MLHQQGGPLPLHVQRRAGRTAAEVIAAGTILSTANAADADTAAILQK
jgi:hypothetical protein